MKTKVSSLPLDTGISGWNGVLPEPATATKLEDKISADWLIVGAGFAGLAATMRLLQLRKNERIVLVDACRVGEGPAGRNSGFLIDLPHDLASENYSGSTQLDKDEILLNRAAINFATQMAEQSGVGKEILNPCGKVNGAVSKKGIDHLQSYQQHLSALDELSTLLSAQQMFELTGSRYYQCGLFTPGTVMIHPAAYVRAIARHLSEQIRLYENTPVISIDESADHYIVTTPRGEIRACKIILAVNGHVQSFGFFKNRLMHVFTYASMTRKMTDQEVKLLGGENQWNIIPADPMGTTVRRISGKAYGGDRIIIRNRVTYNPSMLSSDKQLNQIVLAHKKSFANRFPTLGNMEMEYSWGGRLCLSLNNVPAFGEVAPGIFSATCQNGLGATKGTLSGLLAAELATGLRSNLLEHYLLKDKPKRLMPEPFMSMGAKFVLRAKEWKAGKEM